MQTVYIGNTLVNDVMLGSQRMDDVIGGLPLISDVNAIQFLQATGISQTSPTAISINQLCIDLKASNLFNKFYALYPFVGGTEQTNKYNLINTGSYTLGLSGSWDYSNGIKGNGINTYANTAFVPTSIPNFVTGSSLMVYVTTNATGGYDIGSEDNDANRTYLISRENNNTANLSFTTTQIATASLDSTGMWMGEVSGAAARIELYRNTSSLITPVNSSTNRLPSASYFIGANNFKNTGVNAITSKNYGMASIGKYFTSSEVSTLYTIVQSFETSMSRQV